MTSETLRKACELAGFQHSTPAEGWDCWWILEEPESLWSTTNTRHIGNIDVTSFGMADDHPALLPLVAERLMHLYEDDSSVLWRLEQENYYYSFTTVVSKLYSGNPNFTPTDIRILAFMVALGEMTLEQAEAELDG